MQACGQRSSRHPRQSIVPALSASCSRRWLHEPLHRHTGVESLPHGLSDVCSIATVLRGFVRCGICGCSIVQSLPPATARLRDTLPPTAGPSSCPHFLRNLWVKALAVPQAAHTAARLAPSAGAGGDDRRFPARVPGSPPGTAMGSRRGIRSSGTAGGACHQGQGVTLAA
jgi:hypothetical protein